MVDQEKIKILDYKTPGSFEETRYEKLHSVILDSSTEGSVVIANYIANLILEKQGKNEKCVLGLATGSIPLSIYKELIRMHKVIITLIAIFRYGIIFIKIKCNYILKT